MTTPNSTFPLTQAFELLQQTVQELLSNGRRRVGAFLKSELVRRTGGAFSEGRLGFAKFSDFLRAAEAANFVALTKSGPDLEAWPPGAQPSTVSQLPPISESTVVQRSRINIRPDFWLAFVDFSPGFLRIYDKVYDRAHKIPAAMYPGESEEVTELRRRFQVRDQSLLLLEPIPQTAVLDWMRTFTDRQIGLVAEQMRVAVNSGHPLQAFTQLVRSQPEVYREWHHQRVEKVAEYIRSYFGRNGLKPQVTIPYDPVVAGPPTSPSASIKDVTAALSGIGHQDLPDSIAVLQQIDDAIAALLRLRGTIGYLRSAKKAGQ
jgi:hypothetical protein